MSGLPARLRTAYALPAFALALLGVPVFVHLPRFYAEVAGAPLGALGAAILLTRVVDGVLDPLIGTWSDRVRTRWGRRRPFLAGAALPLAVFAAALFAPPVRGTAAVWWFTALMVLTFAAWTAVQIPHAALGTELTTDHHGRTALFAWRDGFWIAGTLVAAAAPGVMTWLVADGGRTEAERFAALGLLYAALLLVLPVVCAALVTEPPHPGTVDPPVSWRLLRDAWGNRPYRILLLAYAVAALGGALPGTLLYFFVEHVLRLPQWADGLLALYFVSAVAGLPLWTRVANRLGKRPTFRLATAGTVLVFAGSLGLDAGDGWGFAAIVVLSGAGFGATLTLPTSMLADTIDYDEWRTGSRREGLLVGLWGITTKASAAVGAGAALPLLGWAGFVPGDPAPESARLAIQLLYCAVPCLCYAAALVIVGRYPIDEARHRATLHALAGRRDGAGRAPLDSRVDIDVISN